MRFWKSLRDFGHDARGAVAIEYALILVFMGLALIAAFVALGGSLGSLWEDGILPQIEAAFAGAGR